MSKVATFIVRLGFLAVFLFIVSCGDSQPKPGSGPGKTPKDKEISKNTPKDKDISKNTPTTTLTPELKTTADALVKEANKDEKATVAKYKGKIIELEGVVESANQHLETGSLTLVGGKGKFGHLDPICNVVDEYKNKVGWLGRGQKVSVIGKVVGANASTISLYDCRVTEKGPSPTPKLTADELTAEFAKDEAAAKKKYDPEQTHPDHALSTPKEIIVEGTVADVPKIKSEFGIETLAVILPGKDGMTVTCDVNKKTWESVKKGDKVTIKGDVDTILNKDKKTVHIARAYLLQKG